MHRNRNFHAVAPLGVLGLCAAMAHAQETSETPDTNEQLEEVVVTGYRQSLEDAASAKRESTNFTDSVFAEDIGKFPDLNIAESLNRIPGVQLTRDITGEGVNIAIRGLGTDFTKITLNGSQVAVASTGRVDSLNQNREVDLDLFPTELFTRLDVNKTPRASMLEGGVAGTVNMRSARPFDNPGARMSYQVQTGYGELSTKISPRAAVTGSWTNDTFGVLVGVAAVRNKVQTEGFETIGWTNPTITNAMCGTAGAPNGVSAQCNTTGGNGFSLPGVSMTTGFGAVPRGVGNGLIEGTRIDRAFLEANNPGLTLEQIGNAMIPRLGRPAYTEGTRERAAGLLSFEYRPTESLSFYLDTFYAKANREFDRLDVNLIGRNGAIIPLNMQIDENNVVTSATFANAQFFLEARPYDEDTNFYNINPGLHFDFTETLGLDFQLTKMKSIFFREAPSILVNTPLNEGITVQYANNGGDFPSITSNVNLNDPNLGWVWSGGRVNIQNESRVTETQGGRADLQWGSDTANITVGTSYDDVARTIKALDAAREWQQQTCGGGGPFIDAPAQAPPCNGQPGSAIPQSALASYLQPGPYGFITVDFDRFFADTGYQALSDSARVASNAATNAGSGGVRERTWGGFAELNGTREFWGHTVRANAGVRYITTDQEINGPFIIGGIVQQGPFQRLQSDYNKYLPSFNVAVNVTENIIGRVAASRTLTRPNPSSMIPATSFTDPSASTANQGNSNLSPYISDNIDLGGEWYTGREGFVGLMVFQKEVTGFTVLGATTRPFNDLGISFDTLNDSQKSAILSRGGPDVATVVVQQQVNSPAELRIRGYEVTWVQPFGQFWDPLEGFGLNANYTRIQQKSEGTGAPAQAIGISPHSYNATAYYERQNASVRLSYVWNDEQISSIPNQNGIPLAQLYTDAYGQWDLSASYAFDWLPTSPEVTLNVINITSQTQRQTFQFDNATHTFYEPGYQVLVGIRGKF
jgi:TonB-dependent receptor